MRRGIAFFGFTAPLFFAGCMDKAKADWDRCVERDQSYDVAGAVAACSAAVAADPKSPSGQAAAKKLLDLQTVNDKMQVEQAARSQRDAKIKKDEPPQVIVHPADAQAPQPLTIAAQADALVKSGDVAGARALLEPRVIAASGEHDEVVVLRAICKKQHDRTCLATLSNKYGNK